MPMLAPRGIPMINPVSYAAAQPSPVFTPGQRSAPAPAAPVIGDTVSLSGGALAAATVNAQLSGTLDVQQV